MAADGIQGQPLQRRGSYTTLACQGVQRKCGGGEKAGVSPAGRHLITSSSERCFSSVRRMMSLFRAALLRTSLEVQRALESGYWSPSEQSSKYYRHHPSTRALIYAAHVMYLALIDLFLCCLCFCTFFFFVLCHIYFKPCSRLLSQRGWHNEGERKHASLISWLSSCLPSVHESSWMVTSKTPGSSCHHPRLLPLEIPNHKKNQNISLVRKEKNNQRL